MRKIKSGVTMLGLAVTLGLFTSIEAGACASCGCTLNTDWQSLDYSFKPGLKMDIRYDYLNQNQLRSGTGKISSAAASQINTSTGPQEVEKYTENHYITLGFDYSTNMDWGDQSPGAIHHPEPQHPWHGIGWDHPGGWWWTV